MSLSVSEASAVVRSIGPSFLFIPSVPGLTEFLANGLLIDPDLTFDLGLTTLDFGALCF